MKLISLFQLDIIILILFALVERYLCNSIVLNNSDYFSWLDSNKSPEQRAKDLVSEMKTSEKLKMIHGHAGNFKSVYMGHVPENNRLNIPAVNHSYF